MSAYTISVPRSDFAREVIQVCAAVILLLFAVATVPYGSTLVLLLSGCWALLGTREAIQSLTIAVLVRILNPAVFEGAGIDAMLGWFVLALAGARIMLDSLAISRRMPKILLWLFLFVAVVFLESMFISLYPTVSMFKVVSFAFGATAILLGFKTTAARSVDWAPWFVGVWSAVFVWSVPTMFLPDIGYFLDEMGFQGVANHPQAFAVFLVPVVAWSMGKLFFTRSQHNSVYYLLLGIALVFVFLTRARTAPAAIAAGFIIVVLLGFVGQREWRARIRQAFTRPLSLLLILAVSVALIMQEETILEGASGFLFKNVEGVTLSESFEISRGFFIAESLENFLGNIWFGIGFGVSDSAFMPFEPVIEPFTGLPLSASTEKANLPIAVLEETGIIGTAFFIPFIFALIKKVIRSRDMVMIWIFFAMLSTNIAEMTFFSFGGIGLYTWLIYGWASSTRSASH